MGRLRVARDDRYRLDVPNLASGHAASQCTETRIETTIESDHQPTVRTMHHIEAGADSGRAEVDRLFGEYGLADAHRALDQIRMGIGRRADDDSVYVRRRDNRIDRADRRTMRGSEPLCGRRIGIGDGGESCARVRRNIAAMNASDPACTQQSNSHRNVPCGRHYGTAH
jgi:hypothetical protein